MKKAKKSLYRYDRGCFASRTYEAFGRQQENMEKLQLGSLLTLLYAEYKRLPYLELQTKRTSCKKFSRSSKSCASEKNMIIPIILKKSALILWSMVMIGKLDPINLLRNNVIKSFEKQYGGKLIEIPYTKGISSGAYVDSQRNHKHYSRCKKISII